MLTVLIFRSVYISLFILSHLAQRFKYLCDPDSHQYLISEQNEASNKHEAVILVLKNPFIKNCNPFLRPAFRILGASDIGCCSENTQIN